MSFRLALAICGTLAICNSPSTARADELDRARELYQKGEAAFNAGRYAEAANAFDLAFAESQQPKLLWNIAESYRRLYEVDHDPLNLRRARSLYHDFAQVAQTEMEKRAAADGEKAMDAQLAAVRRDSPMKRRAPGIAIAGAGVAVAVVGIALGAVAASDASTVTHAGAPGMPVPFAQVADSYSQGHALEIVSIVCYAVAAVAIVAGVTLAVLKGRERTAPSTAFWPSVRGGTVAWTF